MSYNQPNNFLLLNDDFLNVFEEGTYTGNSIVPLIINNTLKDNYFKNSHTNRISIFMTVP